VPQFVRSARSPRLEWVRSAKSTTFEGTVTSPIKQVATMTGRTADARIETVRIVPEGSPVANYGFDVTPARLMSGLNHRTRRAAGKPRRAGTRFRGAGQKRVSGPNGKGKFLKDLSRRHPNRIGFVLPKKPVVSSTQTQS
jgi:hypothetical protein